MMKPTENGRAALASGTTRVLELLIGFQERGLPPPAARIALQELQSNIPDLRLSLLHEEEEFARAFHYDAIVRAPGEGAVIVGFCPDRGLPWVARGAYRRGEDDLVRVNGVARTVPEAVTELDLAESRELGLCLVRSLLLDAALLEYGLSEARVDDASLQSSLDAFRRARGLLAATEMHAWLGRRGMTIDGLESLLERGARIAMLRDMVTSPHIDGDFEARRHDYDEAIVLLLTGMGGELAVAARAALARASLTDLADVLFHAGVDFELRRLMRFEAPASIVKAFDASDDAVVALPASGGEPAGRWQMARVVGRLASSLDGRVREKIRDRLFSEWLEKRRADAVIEWFWGTANGGSG